MRIVISPLYSTQSSLSLLCYSLPSTLSRGGMQDKKKLDMVDILEKFRVSTKM